MRSRSFCLQSLSVSTSQMSWASRSPDCASVFVTRRMASSSGVILDAPKCAVVNPFFPAVAPVWMWLRPGGVGSIPSGVLPLIIPMDNLRATSSPGVACALGVNVDCHCEHVFLESAVADWTGGASSTATGVLPCERYSAATRSDLMCTTMSRMVAFTCRRPEETNSSSLFGSMVLRACSCLSALSMSARAAPRCWRAATVICCRVRCVVSRRARIFDASSQIPAEYDSTARCVATNVRAVVSPRHMAFSTTVHSDSTRSIRSLGSVGSAICRMGRSTSSVCVFFATST